MTEFDEPVVDVFAIGRREARTAHRPRDNQAHGVGDRHDEDEKRDEQRSEEKVGLVRNWDPRHRTSADDGRGNGKEKAKEQRSAVAHEHPGRAEVVGKKTDAYPPGDDGDERAEVRSVDRSGIEQLRRVEEERYRRNGHDPGGEAIEAVDEIDRVAHADEPEHGHKSREVRGDLNRSEEGHLHLIEGDSERIQRASREHHSGHLCRRGEFEAIVDEPDRRDHDRPHDDTDRLRR